MDGMELLKENEVEVSNLWCPNVDCPDYGKRNQGNIVPKEVYGKNNNWLFRCKTCGHCFSENYGTPFFNLKTPREEVLRVLSLLPEKGSVRGLSRATGHDKNTILRWIRLAGEHCEEVNEYFLRDLELDQVEIDEIWSYIKKRKKRRGR